MLSFAKRIFALASICACAAALADVTVPAGASMQLNGGTLNLGGTNLQIAGSYGLGAGSVINAASILVSAGGLLDASSGFISLFGDWSNLGTFSAGTGSVDFVDGGTAQSALSGANTFYNASFVTGTGKTYIFPSGLTQTVGGLLTIAGTQAAPIQFAGSNPPNAADIKLLRSGSQNIQHVGVSNVHATGQILAPTLHNEGGSGNDNGWFASSVSALEAAVAAPALSVPALLALILSFFAVALRRARRVIP